VKIFIDTVLTQFSGKPILDQESGVPVRLRDVAITALLVAPDQPGEVTTADGKVRRWRLGQKFYGWKEADPTATGREPFTLDAKEVVLLKDLIGRTYGPSIVGPAFDLLEGEAP
jgi:hypothetical protein